MKTAPNPFPDVCPCPGTFFETIIPLSLEAGGAANPTSPAELEVLPSELKGPLPKWVRNVSQKIDQTLAGEILGWVRRPVTWHIAGKAAGLINRFVCFLERELPERLEAIDFAQIPEQRLPELESKFDMEPMRGLLVQRLRREVRPDEPTDSLVDAVFEAYVSDLRGLVAMLSNLAARQTAQNAADFYQGLSEGYVAFLDPQGNFVGQTLRTTTYMELLVLWRPIEQLRMRQPPITRGQLFEWLKVQEVWACPPGLDWFNDLCDEIKLATRPPGRPRRQG